MNYPHLFSPGKIGKVEIPNRIVMPPMATNLGSAFGEVTPEQVEYYRRRAEGGTGLIIIENVQIDMYEGRSLVAQIAIDSDKFLPGLRTLAEAIHNEGSKTFLQIQHGGRQCTISSTDGLQPVAPSAVASQFMQIVPRELTKEEIKKLVNKFAEGALRAKIAGFDGVEIHAAHGYLIAEFLSPYSNKRTDEYGGSLENRMRFLEEIIQETRKLTGEDFALGVRLSVDEFLPGSLKLEETREMARVLEAKGINYLHVTTGNYDSISTIIEPINFEEGWRVYLAEEIKKVVSIPVITVGVIRHPEMADNIVAQGKADFVAIGRGLIADPEWPKKAKSGKIKDINRCISCNVGCIGELLANGKVHCAVNPWAGREFLWGEVRPAEKIKKVVVVGGGPGGMETALLSAQRGHEVILIEKEKELGGQMTLAARPPHKEKIIWFKEYLENELSKWGVKIETGKEADANYVLSFSPEAVVVATGGQPIIPDAWQLDPSVATTAWDVLRGTVKIEGKQVVVIGGGIVGCEVTAFLAEQDNWVTLVEMLPQLAYDAEIITRLEILKELNKENIKTMTQTKCLDVQGSKIVYLCEADPSNSEIQGDYLVFALGTRPNRGLYEALQDKVPEIYLVGDAKSPRKIYQAVLEGAAVARRL
ncbi:MAG: hypothetical protein PWP04_713 [Candidatus Atribacteria bacterium]|nr:hypothetical protein [Candidatus Atribacteria bacterium]